MTSMPTLMCVVDPRLTLCPAPPSDGSWPSTDTAIISPSSVTTAHKRMIVNRDLVVAGNHINPIQPTAYSLGLS